MKRLIAIFSTIFLISCQQEVKSDAKAEASAPGGTEIVIETNQGTIKARLHDETAPITVKNFLKYIDEKHFDKTIFHRVISNFMIQGGGFEIVNEVPKEKKTGEGIKNESAKTKSNARGTLAMARTNDPNSATAQFYINVKDNANLDFPNAGGQGYAVFGEVTEGMEVVDKIKEVKTHTTSALSMMPDGRFNVSPFSDVPVEPVVILSIRRATAAQ